jgi:dipeptidyl aminopeptidase/acylaminoacyl peptidase
VQRSANRRPRPSLLFQQFRGLEATHNPKVAGSNPAPATKIYGPKSKGFGPFSLYRPHRQITPKNDNCRHAPTRTAGTQAGTKYGRATRFGADFQWHIWIVDAGGGTPRQLTTQTGNQHVPSWSRDGQWIYYSVDQGKGIDIWRIPATGGSPQRITSGGSGRVAYETADGRNVLYQLKDSDSPLLVKPLAEGRPRQLVACVKPTAFGVGLHGIYYVPCDSSANPPVHVIDLRTGRDRRLGTLEQFEQSVNAPPLGLSVAPDGQSLLYQRHTTDSADLMSIENFR